ncbi:MAG TPA: hypothetical protein VFB45_04645 [Pseudolabrys sp.]|nr:hypothetical protein [Pseudolabrys sp.]
MFLSKRTYVKSWEWTKPEDRYEIAITKGGKPADIRADRIKEVVEQIAYWHNANAIHRWFVEIAQSGNDDGGEYYVKTEWLRDLLSRCMLVLAGSELTEGEITKGYRYVDGKETPIIEAGKVIKDPTTAMTLLPTDDGFGSTEYDEEYLDVIRCTKDALERLLAEEADGGFYYSATW